MKKFYSLVLMATALLIGTNAWAAGNVAKIGSTEYATLEQAWQAAQNGSTIQMISDANLTHTLWLGTATMEDANPKSITLDLNGKVITVSAAIERAFYLTHGELNITGTGEIHHTDSCASSSFEVFRLGGSTYKTVNPKDENVNYYTHLTIGPNVYVKAKGNAIGVDMMSGWPSTNVNTNAIPTAGVTKPTTLYNTLIYKHNSSNYGSAYGVRVDVYGALFGNKYAIKANGNLGSPMTDVAWDSNGKTANYNLGDYYKNNPTDATGIYEVLPADNVYTPFIYIHSGADLRVPADNTSLLKDADKPVAVYCSGYARWKIEGTCVGSTAVYVKSGEVDIKDATIESNYTGNYQKPQETGSGVVSQGSAIVIQSSTAYAGDADVKISGDTKVSATNGYAIEEAITNANGESKVDAITIDGGTFAGGNVGTKEKPEEGTIIITETTVNKTNEEDPTVKTVTIGGLSVTGTGTYVTQDEDGVSIGGQTLADYFASQGNSTHVTTVPDGDGSYTYVITPGPALDEGDDLLVGNMVSEQSTDARIKWTVNQKDTIKTGVSLKLAELEINTEGLAQELVIEDGATFEVGRVVLGPDAKIIVEPGAKFIVSGKYGIVAPSVNNIVLRTSEAAQAMFLFNPEVSSNRNPNATVELISKAYRKANGQYVFQRFGVPSSSKDITRADMIYTVPTAIYRYDYEADDWLSMANTDKFVPFQCYELTTQQAAAGEVYTFKCPLMGNDNAELTLHQTWNYYANSYVAPINIKQMINRFKNDNADAIQPTVYLYDAETNWWTPLNNASYLLPTSTAPKEINPMQAFIFKRTGDGADPVVKYDEHIWTPIMDPSNNAFKAPARNRQMVGTAVIEIESANGVKDQVTLIESEQFSADNDLSYDAEKYMNTESFNIFADGVEAPMAILATDDLEGTMLSMSSKAQTSFTMTFNNVSNMNYAVRDMLTGTETEIVEGATYMFSVAENATIEGRFQIVAVSKVATSIENIEEVAAVKGIYTITGQFVGNNYHNLPNGVYVIDGKKIVK